MSFENNKVNLNILRAAFIFIIKYFANSYPHVFALRKKHLKNKLKNLILLKLSFDHDNISVSKLPNIKDCNMMEIFVSIK